MRPLNYAILKYMTTVEKASAVDVIRELKPEYGKFKMLTEDNVVDALMTAESNGLLEEDGYDVDDNGKVTIYYKCIDPESINKYIK
ncbi:MAG: hypothetical protein ACI3W6_03960 [Clostridia bacterium]